MDPETILRELQAIRQKSVRQIEQDLRSSSLLPDAGDGLILAAALGVKLLAINLLAELDPAVRLAQLN